MKKTSSAFQIKLKDVCDKICKLEEASSKKNISWEENAKKRSEEKKKHILASAPELSTGFEYLPTFIDRLAFENKVRQAVMSIENGL